MARSPHRRGPEASKTATQLESSGNRSSAARNERRQAFAIAIVLAAVTLAIYAPAVVVPFDFVNYDDPIYVTGNPVVRSGLSLANLRWAAVNEVGGNWHPLTVASHMLDVELYGLAPRGHHLTSVLLHAANAVLLFCVLRSMTSALWPSALAAALFAWHPLRVESVAWISERKDVLSTCFLLLALAAYVRFARRGSWTAYGAMVVCFALGLLSKPMLVTFPAMLLLLDVWPLGRVAWLRPSGGDFAPASIWRLIGEKLPLAPLSAAISFITLSTQAGGIQETPLVERLAAAVDACWAYLAKALFPYPLYIPYLKSDVETSTAWTLVGAAGLIALTLLAAVSIWRRPYVTSGWFWFLGTLVPVIGLVPVGEQALADRYTYVPLIGLGWLIAWACAELAARSEVWREAVIVGASAALVALAALAVFQVTRWRDTETLFAHTVRHAPDNYVALSYLAVDAFHRGDYPAAIAHAHSALEWAPLATDPAAVLAQSLARTGRTEEAIAEYQQVIARNPNHAFLMNELASLLATCDEARYRHGAAALRLAEAASDLYGGRNPQILDTLAAAYAELGDWPQAVATAEQAQAQTRAMVAAGDVEAEPLLRGIEGRLALYRQQIPYRAPGGVWD